MATCTCNKPSLCAYNSVAQTVAAGGALSFDTNKVLTGTAITHAAGTTAVTISKAGVYFVSVDADVLPSGTGDITVQLYNNAVAIPDAEATFTGATTTTQHIHFDTLIKVLPSCCVVSNTANLTVDCSLAATVTNAKITVF